MKVRICKSSLESETHFLAKKMTDLDSKMEERYLFLVASSIFVFEKVGSITIYLFQFVSSLIQASSLTPQVEEMDKSKINEKNLNT